MKNGESRMEQIKLIEKLLEIRKYKEIKEILKEMNDVDVAEMLEGFSDENMIRIFRLLPKDDAADIFAYICLLYTSDAADD